MVPAVPVPDVPSTRCGMCMIMTVFVRTVAACARHCCRRNSDLLGSEQIMVCFAPRAGERGKQGNSKRKQRAARQTGCKEDAHGKRRNKPVKRTWCNLLIVARSFACASLK